MIVPNIQEIAGIPIVDKDGKPTAGFLTFLSILLTEMSQKLSETGFVYPAQPTSVLTNIENSTPAQNGIGRIIYDADTQTFKLNNDGTFKTIATL